MGNSIESHLKIREVGSLVEDFIIPSFQRGYRWERLQVKQLLEDLLEHSNKISDEPYYLQPIVVSRNLDGSCDVIDGQQRLTTLLILCKVLLEKYNKHINNEMRDKEDDEFYVKVKDLKCCYTIKYKTRPGSEDFLSNIVQDKFTDKNGFERIVKDVAHETPDYLYMWHAAQEINSFVTKKNIDSIARIFSEQLKIIWYELPGSSPSWKKFSDLNIGKIPLTNSELIKALFLQQKTEGKDKIKENYEQEIIVSQWDRIERELSNPTFWYFLTTKPIDSYPTKIDLLFDLIANKPKELHKDHFFTFRFFVEKLKENDKKTSKEKKTFKQLWNDIHLKYLCLRDWYLDRELYHRIGYLITSNFPENTLQQIFNKVFPPKIQDTNHELEKDFGSQKELRQWLRDQIINSLKLPDGIESFSDLKYNASSNPDSTPDTKYHDLIKRYLTLYNIKLLENIDSHSRYPFDHHNNVDGGWSLEHIHAQNSKPLEKKEQWQNWFTSHLESAKKLEVNLKVSEELKRELRSLIEEMEKIDEPNGTLYNQFHKKYSELMGRLSEEGMGLYKDEFANMALLGKNTNSKLNNSTFDVKRRIIIESMGSDFIPKATERIFAKAISGTRTYDHKDGNSVGSVYNNDIDNLYFWSHKDRNAYLADIREKLHEYLN